MLFLKIRNLMVIVTAVGIIGSSAFAIGGRGGGDPDAVEALRHAYEVSYWFTDEQMSKTIGVDALRFQIVSLGLILEWQKSLNDDSDHPKVALLRFSPFPVYDDNGIPKIAKISRKEHSVTFYRKDWNNLSDIKKFVTLAIEISTTLEIPNRYDVGSMAESYIQGPHKKAIPFTTKDLETFIAIQKSILKILDSDDPSESNGAMPKKVDVNNSTTPTCYDREQAVEMAASQWSASPKIYNICPDSETKSMGADAAYVIGFSGIYSLNNTASTITNLQCLAFTNLIAAFAHPTKKVNIVYVRNVPIESFAGKNCSVGIDLALPHILPNQCRGRATLMTTSLWFEDKIQPVKICQ